MDGGGRLSRLFAEPLAIRLQWCEGEIESLRVGTARLMVVEIVRRWRVEADWWKDGPAREYLTVRTAEGHLLDVYGDRRSGEWYLQRLMD